MFKKLTVTNRLAMTIGTLSAVLLSVVGAAIYALASLHASTVDINTSWLPSVETLAQMNTAKSDLRVLEWQHLSSAGAAAKSGVERKLAEKRSEFELLSSFYTKQLITSSEERKIYESFAADWTVYLQTQEKLLALSRNGENEAAVKLMQGDSSRLFDSSSAWLQKAIDVNQKGATAQGENSENIYRKARTALIAAAALATAVACALALMIIRTFALELGGEPVEAQRIAASIAHGDLTRSVVVKAGDNSSLMASLAAMHESLGRTVAQVRANSETVAAAAAQIALGNQDLSQRTEEQASALQQTAATMDQLNVTVGHNADRAEQANQLAQGASAVAVQGGEVIGQVVATMQGISDSSRKISDIIGVIDGIAFQTNILALNAAVEAARAGEQGRGFAVVAGEVRTLAQRSAEAAKEIKSLIGRSVNQVESGTLLVDQAGKTMGDIVGSILRVTEIVGEMTAASVEQRSGIAQVGVALNQMDQVTQQNASLVEESAAAAESLKRQGRQLVQAVSVFKLSSGRPAGASYAAEAGPGAEIVA